jgi:hypothetical protein
MSTAAGSIATSLLLDRRSVDDPGLWLAPPVDFCGELTELTSVHDACRGLPLSMHAMPYCPS